MIPLRDHTPSKKFPFVVLAIIAINILVFWLELTQGEAFIEKYALIPASVSLSHFSSLLPFITSMFLHGGIIHIASNLWFLWIFGDNVEGEFGHVKFTLLYLLFGIAGSLAQYLISPGLNVPMLGASGAIAGVMGSYLVLHPHGKIDTLMPTFGFFYRTTLPAYAMLGYWILFQFLGGFGSLGANPEGAPLGGGVAFFAHIGGFASGYILTKMIYSRKI